MFHTLAFKLTVLISKVAFAVARRLEPIHKPTWQRRCNSVGHQVILCYLRWRYFRILPLVSNTALAGNGLEMCPNERILWTYWSQGLEAAPLVVNACLTSMRRNIGSFRLTIIDDASLADYFDLPPAVRIRHNEGSLSKTHLSDVIRFGLLERFGGLWADATVFVKDEIPNELLGPGFFTRKMPPTTTYFNVSDRRWSSFLIGGQSSLPLWHAMNMLLESYWSDHTKVIDYFLTDYFLRMLYDADYGGTKQAIDSVAVNNKACDDLTPLLLAPANAPLVRKTLKAPDTHFYKLSWKQAEIDRLSAVPAGSALEELGRGGNYGLR